MSPKAKVADVEDQPPTPIGTEKVEYWLFVSNTGLRESFKLRTEIGEKVDILKSPLDASFLSYVVTLKAGDEKNELLGRMVFPFASLFHVDVAPRMDPIYAKGDSPVEREIVKEQLAKAKRIEDHASKLEERLGADDDPEDNQ